MKKLILVFALLALNLTASAAVIFQDNFDNCSQNCNSAALSAPTGWTQWYGPGSSTIGGVTHYAGEITAPGRSGSGKSFKIWRNGASWSDYNGVLHYYFDGSYSEIYMRYYKKIPTAMDLSQCSGSNYQKLWRLNVSGSAGEIYLNINQNGGSLRNTGTLEMMTNTKSWVTILNHTDLAATWDGNWHSWEWRVNLSAGSVQLWIDGVSKYSGTGWNFGGGTFSMMQHFSMGNHAEGCSWQSSWQAMDIDDFVLSTTYVGPDGSSGGGGTTTTTPTISNVAGTVSTGQTLTITGANLVQDKKSAWDGFFSNYPTSYGFEGTKTGDGYTELGTSGGTYVSDVKLMGSKSIKFHSQGAWPEGPGGLGDMAAINPRGTDGDSGDIWIRFYCRWNLLGGAWPTNYMKIIDSQGGPVNQYYLDMAGASSGAPTSFNATYDSAGHDVTIPGGALIEDRWYTIELHWKSTSPRSYQLWVDGVQLVNATPSMNSTVEYLLFGIINLAGTASAFSLDTWFDGLAFGPSRIYPASTIEISGDGSTWKYQEPVFLSDTSSQIKVNLSGVTGTSYRLRVTNNAQQTSAIYTLSGGGGGGDTQAPSVPAGLAASVISSSQINLSWSASTDNVGVTGYKIYRGGTLLTTTTSRTYNNTGLAASTAYSYMVSAIDAAGNESSQCTAVSATTQAAQVTDTTKPLVPAGLAASVISSSQINLSWSASTDNVGVTGYKIYRGGTLLTTTTSRTYNNTGLTASTAYSYRVSAIDAAGNESSQCTAVSATTQAAQVTDTTKPSVPAGLAASVISSSQINLSWSASTDNVGVTGYKIYRGGTLLTTTISRTHNDTGLSASTAYSYRVSAIDAAGNESNQCTAVSATTQAGSSAGAILFQESFSDNSFASRNWYDNTAHGTVVSGGQSGNCLQWAWSQGGTTATNGGSMRMKFTATDSLYVSFYVKFQSGWRGSQKSYHPHMILIPSNLDSEYTPLANNYLNTYIEFVSDVGSPYTIRPAIAIQDEKRVNTSNGTPPNNLTAITENRSVAYCNTPVSSGASGICYADNPYYSANTWKASSASVSTNVWHHVEVYFKMNTISGGKGLSNGIMQKWVDGALVINKSDVLYRTNQDATKKWAQFVLAPYIGDGSPIAQSMWIDELTVGTALPSSGTLQAPTGFSVKGP